MEKFMLIFRGSDVDQPGRSAEAVQALKQNMINRVTELSKKGMHVASEPLEPTGQQVSGTKRTVTNFPFGEKKKLLAGVLLYRLKILMRPLKLPKAVLF